MDWTPNVVFVVVVVSHCISFYSHDGIEKKTKNSKPIIRKRKTGINRHLVCNLLLYVCTDTCHKNVARITEYPLK